MERDNILKLNNLETAVREEEETTNREGKDYRKAKYDKGDYRRLGSHCGGTDCEEW